MISMKTNENEVSEAPANEYGYGLRIYLNDDQCEALGIKTPITAGAKVRLNCLAYVCSATESVEDDGDDTGNDVSLNLQITDMELSRADTKSPAEALYGQS